MSTKCFFVLVLPVFLVYSCQSTSGDYWESGFEKFKLHDYQGAIMDYNKAIELNPLSSGAYCERAISKSITDDVIGAIADYSRAIDLANFDDEIFLFENRGRCKFHLQDFRGALADFDQAIEIDTTYSHAYFLRGRTMFKLGEYKRAITDCSKAISLDSTFGNFRYDSGDRHRQRDSLQDKISYFSELTWVVESNDEITRYFSARGAARLAILDSVGAEMDFSEALKLDSTEQLTSLFRGEARMILHDYNEAVLDFSKTIHLNPHNEQAHYSRGLSKLELGDKEGGCLDLSKAGELGSDRAYEKIRELCQ